MKSKSILIIFLALVSIVFSSCEKKPKRAVIETEYGNMIVELFDSTPQHRDNFVKLVKAHYYDDLLFHRIIKNFMIQGGDPDSKNSAPDQMLGGGGPGYLIPAEIGAPHFKGALAAARTNNPEKASSGSQFYIVQGLFQNDITLESFERQKGIKYNQAQLNKYKEVGGTPQLDMEYTVFGEVVSGMEVIDKIAAAETGQNDRPVKDIKMKVRLLN